MLYWKETGMMNSTKGGQHMREFLMQCRYKSASVVLFLSLMLPGLFAGSAAAAGPAPGQSSVQRDRDGGRDDDFLFSAPKGFIGFRIGKFFPRANGDLFDMITDELTLEKNDFRAWDFGLDGGFYLHERVGLIFSAEYMKRTKHSEFRDWVDDQELPITQTTYYSQFPLTAGVKILLTPRGRQVGQYAWLPSRFVPYIGTGAGILWYRFGQWGDFVDFETSDIFTANLESSGWTATGYVGGGVDVNIARHIYLTLDLRYSWAKPELNRDYVGFDPLDLSGIRATAGLQWHF
jgi:opacity protein-like surface antigen